jgi:hypothetical protein
VAKGDWQPHNRDTISWSRNGFRIWGVFPEA